MSFAKIIRSFCKTNFYNTDKIEVFGKFIREIGENTPEKPSFIKSEFGLGIGMAAQQFKRRSD